MPFKMQKRISNFVQLHKVDKIRAVHPDKGIITQLLLKIFEIGANRIFFFFRKNVTIIPLCLNEKDVFEIDFDDMLAQVFEENAVSQNNGATLVSFFCFGVSLLKFCEFLDGKFDTMLQVETIKRFGKKGIRMGRFCPLKSCPVSICSEENNGQRLGLVDERRCLDAVHSALQFDVHEYQVGCVFDEAFEGGSSRSYHVGHPETQVLKRHFDIGGNNRVIFHDEDFDCFHSRK